MIFLNRFQKENSLTMSERWSRSMILLAIISNHLEIHKSTLIASGLFIRSIYLSRLENVGDIEVINWVCSFQMGNTIYLDKIVIFKVR